MRENADESFLEDSSTINFLKLRASYGVIGNDRVIKNAERISPFIKGVNHSFF